MKRTRTPFKLCNSIHHQLNMYALAASAAGVGMLALSSPAQAKIVYTSAHQDLSYGYNSLDLNHDGITDFVIWGDAACDESRCWDAVLVYSAAQSNAFVGKSGNATPIWPGQVIGPERRFQRPYGEIVGRRCSLNSTGKCIVTAIYGPWANGGKGFHGHYLGLKFLINGKFHYGWARLNTVTGSLATLTGYAYETIPDKPITTGETKGPDVITLEPGSLGALAAGRK